MPNVGHEFIIMELTNHQNISSFHAKITNTPPTIGHPETTPVQVVYT